MTKKNSEISPTAYVNGEISNLENAKISIFDRGFLFGDGVYEVLRIYRSSVLFFEEHWERLKRSCEGILINNLLEKEELFKIILNLIEISKIKEGIVYIQVTRGISKKRCDFPFPSKPSIIVVVDSLDDFEDEIAFRGVKAITVPHIRWPWNYLKTINLLPRVLMKEKARRDGAYESIFISEDGSVLEGTSTNIFIVKNASIFTPPLNEKILAGVTRNMLLKLGKKEGLNIEEKKIFKEELYTSDEIFLTGTTTEVVGVIMVDNKIIGDGKVGEITKTLKNLYLKYIHESI